MLKVLSKFVSFLALMGWGYSANAGPIYADSADWQDVTFSLGGTLTGAPDGTGAWLSNTFDPPDRLGWITAGFAGGLADGAGVDLIIHDFSGGSPLPNANETADVFVSTDGVAFSLLGAYGAGVNSFDFNGVYANTIYFVKIVNTSQLDSPDIDAFEGVYAANVPVPATLALVGLGLAGLGWSRRKKA